MNGSENGDIDREVVAGFWRRTVAFLIDGVVLGLAGMAVSILFFEPLSAMGAWARLIGFGIGALYFGFLEGGAGRCQSVGKRMMKIKVVRCQDDGLATLRVGQALVRYVIVAIPLVLGGIGFVDIAALRTPDMAWLSSANTLLVFLWGTALLYLLVFNRPTQQSLHDLAVSSLVVRLSANHACSIPPRRRHWLVMGVLGTLVAIASLLANRYMASNLAELVAIQRAAATIPGVTQSAVSAGSVWKVGSATQSPHTVTTISIVSSDPALQSGQGALAVARVAFAASPLLRRQDVLTIVCVRAVDLGIASWKTQFVESWPPGKWASMIAAHSDATGK